MPAAQASGESDMKTSGTTHEEGYRKAVHGHPNVRSSEGQDRKPQSLQWQRKQLPIWSARDRLIEELRQRPTLVLIGETGSGKTTQLPQFLLDAGFAKGGAVACTQPRRVAAVSVASRVARERRVILGAEVGYCIRFDDKTSPSTRLKYMTDGMLLREALIDPLLHRYKVIVLDEAHERTVQTDVLFSLIKSAQEKRKDGLRLVVMSATLDAAKFASYFNGAKAAYLQGRQHPVEIFYTAAPEDSYVDAALTTVLQVHCEEAPGDILVFLTGQDEIENMERLITNRSAQLKGPEGAEKLLVVTIFAAQAPEQQMAVFQAAPAGIRKVILATNIAETSITVPGVRYVVDTGFVKARAYKARLATESLQVVPISQAQARQRSGRAGREAPGKAFRLYTEDTFASLAPATSPEIQRVRLTSVVLQLKALGVPDPLRFDFLDRPPTGALLRALEQLYALGALDPEGNLTKPLGDNLSRLPLEPTLGKVLLTAVATNCAQQALAIVAMASTDAVFLTSRQKKEDAAITHRRFVDSTGDHLTLAAVYAAYTAVEPSQRGRWCAQHHLNARSLRKAADIYRQLSELLAGLKLPTGQSVKASGTKEGGDSSEEALRKALTAGLFMHAAARQPDGTYRVITSSQTVHIHPSSVLCGKKAKCIVFSELIHTTRNYAHQVTAIDSAWLPVLAPAVFANRGLAS